MKKLKDFKILIIVFIFIFALFILYKNYNYDFDSYYSYINTEEKELEDNDQGSSYFEDTQKKVDEKRNNLIKDNLNGNYKTLYNLFTNKENRSNSEILHYINLINNSKDINDYINNAITVENELNIDLFTLMTVNKDLHDNNKKLIYLYPITYDFSNMSDYYVSEDYTRQLAFFKKYRIELLKVYGYSDSEAKKVSSDIDKMFHEIASNSKLSDTYQDYNNIYHIINREELQKIYTNINIDNYLDRLNIKEDRFSILDIGNYTKMNSYLTNDNLTLLKQYSLIKILEKYALYMDMNYYNVMNNYYNLISNKENKIEDDALDFIYNYYENSIDKLYKEKYFNDSDKEYLENLVNDIIPYYEDNFNNIEWLNKDTKELIIDKLKSIKVNIAVINNNYDSKYHIDNHLSLVKNVINMDNIISEYVLDSLTMDDEDSILNQTMVNAFYNPLDNSINFPVCIMDLFNKEDTYYQNLGNIGMIIAHEITHAFDDKGSMFDKNGNLKTLWSEEELKRFNELKEKVIKYYDELYVINGLKVDGERTITENIADLGAVNAITNIAIKKGASKEELKDMYTSFAKLWYEYYSDEYLIQLTLIDTHAPNTIRVDATLGTIDKFYELYDLNSRSDMYVPKENRVKIW